MATGCLSMPKEVDIEGADRFGGEVYFTSRWPHEGVDLTGKRVAVIGTGSSGVQSIPLIAEQAAELTVFQRTPALLGARAQRPASAGSARRNRSRPRRLPRCGEACRAAASLRSRSSSPRRCVSEEERRARFEAAYEAGELFAILGIFADQAVNPEANDIVAEMIREKIRSIVNDPETAESLCPKDYYVRHQAAVPRHGLLRDVQPPARPSGRPAQGPDQDDHRDRHRHGRRVVRVRCHRLRDRIRRDDRRAGRRSTSPAAMASRSKQKWARRSDDLPRPDDRRLPEPLRHHRAREARRCCRT